MTDASNDVFISYKAEDRKRLVPLVEALEAEGFNVWWDQHIGGGTNWREEIESHLDAAKVVIVVWSKRTVGPEGRFVRDEASAAQEAGHYLPITIDNVRPPLGFREHQAISLSSWKGHSSAAWRPGPCQHSGDQCWSADQPPGGDRRRGRGDTRGCGRARLVLHARHRGKYQQCRRPALCQSQRRSGAGLFFGRSCGRGA
ncbi:toll/interleukin-1 receptor domain-containing protein [Sphingomonas lutea]|uniref:Toll/interleukin-1 receptor domain-containing protein n=1 Tax=Sphingomonas lutea TaxID=1045317 RepID=A0A7G9SHD8_9SPHN|nr:toll/interleukin-1 receptor domain-containing protein [Sphingomonas lutea]QNN67263.1 toll/interleukin-1 receptor domain-containing protein [Sphingomonas lutea]